MTNSMLIQSMFPAAKKLICVLLIMSKPGNFKFFLEGTLSYGKVKGTIPKRMISPYSIFVTIVSPNKTPVIRGRSV